MKIGVQISNTVIRDAVEEAAAKLGAQVVVLDDSFDRSAAGSEGAPEILIIQTNSDADWAAWRAFSRLAGAALVSACDAADACGGFNADADEWVLPTTTPQEMAVRLRAVNERRTSRRRGGSEGAELVRYEELLYDKLTGFPTLPVMIDRARELLERRDELTVLYIHFVWYEKIEEIYGWQKLDDVLQTTASAVRQIYDREHAGTESIMMVSHIADDDFILFTHASSSPDAAERRLRTMAQKLETELRTRVEDAHSEDIAALCGIYVGAATVFRNPKIRTERLIYRGIREASNAAHGAEEWERTRKVSDLKSTIRDGAVFIEYHPIIVTATQEVYGFEALARGVRRELRSPEVLFEVANEANMVWELSRLLRRRAVSGILNELKDGQFLFLNIDPHDFDDPTFRNLNPKDLGIDDPSRVVLEITERTAIKDYPRFQEYLSAFRERGFKFAVDDAGSGYAGLGSIANLAPDYIKLDISLIANIDSNFIKQNLVETMVSFANQQGAMVIAEGVERQEEFEAVKQLGVHLTQGFLFHRPHYSKSTAEKTTAVVSHANNRPADPGAAAGG
ncbi:MAG TPA: GGDEF domain-containing phosphodiesterase [Longimicrobiales bacterium]